MFRRGNVCLRSRDSRLLRKKIYKKSVDLFVGKTVLQFSRGVFLGVDALINTTLFLKNL